MRKSTPPRSVGGRDVLWPVVMPGTPAHQRIGSGAGAGNRIKGGAYFFSTQHSIVPPPPTYTPGGVAWCERDAGLLYIYHNVYFVSYRHFSRMKYIN